MNEPKQFPAKMYTLDGGTWLGTLNSQEAWDTIKNLQWVKEVDYYFSYPEKKEEKTVNNYFNNQ